MLRIKKSYVKLKNIRNDCSTGYDNIPIEFVKLVADFVSSPITHIINKSIDESTFPEAWKIARISPIPKITTPLDFNDYRPISILPTLSKLFKRIVMKQLVEFIDRRKLYSNTQSGFRKHHSTNTILLKLRDDILNAMEKGELTLAVLADFSKAFDTVDYEVLIRKLNTVHMSKSFQLFVLNYLTNRKQFIQIDDKSSSYATIHFGVPQGSILGPILFNLYVCDMIEVSKSKCLQYADDTNIYDHCKPVNIKTCREQIGKSTEDILTWSDHNNLAFNNGKTKYMLFSTKQLDIRNNLSSHDQDLLIGDTSMSLKRTAEHKILGIHFDQHLSWNKQVNELLRSCYSTLATLKKLRRLAPYHIRKNLVEAFVITKLDYCNTVYNPLPEYQIKRLQKIQNSAAAFVIGRFANTSDVIKLNWLPVKERVTHSLLKLCFKALHNNSFPEYLKLQFAEKKRNLR